MVSSRKKIRRFPKRSFKITKESSTTRTRSRLQHPNHHKVLRFPFEKLVKENKQVNLIRLNLNEAVIPESIEQQVVGINKDIKQTIKDLHTVLSGI